MATPTQMYDHELNPVQGWPSQSALDKTLPMTDATDTIYAGMGMHICHAGGTFTKGGQGSNATTTRACPIIFALQNSTDFDVAGDDGNTVPSTPRLSGLVSTGAYELETTEFVTSSTYYPGALLECEYSTALGGSDTNQGKLQPATAYANDTVICGVVSELGTDRRHGFDSAPANGYSYNEYGKNVLRFWTCFLPPAS